MIKERLSEETWRTCVDSTPIFGIDMIIFSQKCGVLMGRRINDPAKGKLFVPGGRIYKNECIVDAFNRILLSETGLTFSFDKTTSMGLYEHFYNVTSWSASESSTHYIIEARLIEVEPKDINSKINLSEQHSNFEWISLEDIHSNSIHSYSKMYLDKIKHIKS